MNGNKVVRDCGRSRVPNWSGRKKTGMGRYRTWTCRDKKEQAKTKMDITGTIKLSLFVPFLSLVVPILSLFVPILSLVPRITTWVYCWVCHQLGHTVFNVFNISNLLNFILAFQVQVQVQVLEALNPVDPLHSCDV